MFKKAVFLLIIFFSVPSFANLCWINQWWNHDPEAGGGSWGTCPKNGSKDTGHNCTWQCSGGSCSCKKNTNNCPAPMKKNSLGQCVPNNSISPADCKAKGGNYVDASSFSSLSSVDNAVASLSGSGCYSPAWVHKKENALKSKIKNLVSPKHLLTAAIALLPIGKIFKIPAIADSLLNAFKKKILGPKTLQNNKPVVTFKYNPDTGEFTPDVNLIPRKKPLTDSELLQAPSTPAESKNIIDVDPAVKPFVDSKFTDFSPETPGELRNEKISYDLDSNPQVKTKIASDLRDIFKRSEIKDPNSNLPATYEIKAPTDTAPETFPLTIPDSAAPGGKIATIVTRHFKHLNANNYQVTYTIKSPGTSAATTVNYKITLTPDDAQITPQYKISSNKYLVGQQGNLYNPKNNFASPAPVTKTPVKPNTSTATPGSNTYNTYNYNTYNYNTSTQNKNNSSLPNTSTFVTPAQNAITTAFNYKISLFTCPSVSPKCPNAIEIAWNNMGIKGKYKIPDPMCAVITAIDNPKISPAITTAGNLIVLIAGILGALSLFRRN